MVGGNHGCLLRYTIASQLGLVEVISQMSDDEIWQIYPSLVYSRVGDRCDIVVCYVPYSRSQVSVLEEPNN